MLLKRPNCASLYAMSEIGLLTSRQVAARLGKTITTVNRMVASGRLTPALQVPGYRGARLFDEASLEGLVSDRQESPDAKTEGSES